MDVAEIVQLYKAHVHTPAALNSHLTDRVTLQALLDSAETGLNDRTACEAAGVDPRTVIAWQKLAEENPQQYPAHLAFCLALKEARARGKQELLRRIRKASEKEHLWTAAAWTLERTDPEQFALRKDDSQVPRVVVQLGGNVGDVKVGILLSPSPADCPLVSVTETPPLLPSPTDHK